MYATKAIPIPMHWVLWRAEKFRAHAFVDSKRAEVAGLDLDKIESPYDLWNSKLPQDSYFVFYADTDRQVKELVAGNELYKRLQKNPKYAVLEVFFGN